MRSRTRDRRLRVAARRTCSCRRRRRCARAPKRRQRGVDIGADRLERRERELVVAAGEAREARGDLGQRIAHRAEQQAPLRHADRRAATSPDVSPATSRARDLGAGRAERVHLAERGEPAGRPATTPDYRPASGGRRSHHGAPARADARQPEQGRLVAEACRELHAERHAVARRTAERHAHRRLPAGVEELRVARSRPDARDERGRRAPARARARRSPPAWQRHRRREQHVEAREEARRPRARPRGSCGSRARSRRRSPRGRPAP